MSAGVNSRSPIQKGWSHFDATSDHLNGSLQLLYHFVKPFFLNRSRSLSLLEANFRDRERLFFVPDLIAAMLRYDIIFS